jgi:hypothetical protein
LQPVDYTPKDFHDKRFTIFAQVGKVFCSSQNQIFPDIISGTSSLGFIAACAGNEKKLAQQKTDCLSARILQS